MQIIRPTGIIEGGHGQRWWASLELSDQGQESQSRHPQSARCMLLAWFAKLNTGALGMTGRDARGHRGAGLKTAATTEKRRGGRAVVRVTVRPVRRQEMRPMAITP